MVEKTKGKFNEFSQAAKDKFESAKNFIMNPINTAKYKVSEFIGSLVSGFTSKISTLSSTVSTTFNKIKGFIVTPIEKARDLVNTAVSKIKGFFSGLNLKIPPIKMPKLPHFKLTGKFSLDPPSVPKLGIEWYAKGGVMTNPTVFGMNGSDLMVGGEAGAEAILPLTANVLAGIGKGIAAQMQPQGQQPVIIQAAPIYLDGELIGEATFNTVSRLQYNSATMAAITKGVNL